MSLIRRRKRDPLEWRNDRRERHDLLLMYDFNLDRVNVALATFEAQQRRDDRDDDQERRHVC